MKPGVYSARYAGENASYEDNYRKLLTELHGVPREHRGAQFRCVTVFVAANAEEQAEGICKGGILTEPRGTRGFGYDPVFVPEGYDQTFAELPEEVKNRISHRARALMQMKKFLLTRFS
jgi:XTP/dITP diphosphohydrolase